LALHGRMLTNKYRKTRNRRNRRRSAKHRRTAARRHRKQRGGGFSYVVPDSAIVRWRSLDDEGTQPPVFLLKSDADKAEEEMERVIS
jgi:hypothetical protein